MGFDSGARNDLRLRAVRMVFPLGWAARQLATNWRNSAADITANGDRRFDAGKRILRPPGQRKPARKRPKRSKVHIVASGGDSLVDLRFCQQLWRDGLSDELFERATGFRHIPVRTIQYCRCILWPLQ